MSPVARRHWLLALLLAAFGFLPLNYLVRNQLRGYDLAPGGPQGNWLVPSYSATHIMSLGFDGFAADVYWTEAIQYFGTFKLAHAQNFPQLVSLLRLAQRLDPDLSAVPEYGALLLCDQPPLGAGHPRAAVELLQAALRRHPTRWRLYYNLGFVYALNLHDPGDAAQAFLRGAQLPGAHPIMKTMAALYAAKASQNELAWNLWMSIYKTSPDQGLRNSALDHLQSMVAQRQIRRLQQRTCQLIRKGEWVSWRGLVSARLTTGVILDPQRRPYRLHPDGSVTLSPQTHFYSFQQPPPLSCR